MGSCFNMQVPKPRLLLPHEKGGQLHVGCQPSPVELPALAQPRAKSLVR